MPCDPFAVGLEGLLLPDVSTVLAVMDVQELFVDKPYTASPNFSLLARGGDDGDDSEGEDEWEEEEERAVSWPCGMLYML